MKTDYILIGLVSLFVSLPAFAKDSSHSMHKYSGDKAVKKIQEILADVDSAFGMALDNYGSFGEKSRKTILEAALKKAGLETSQLKKLLTVSAPGMETAMKAYMQEFYKNPLTILKKNKVTVEQVGHIFKYQLDDHYYRLNKRKTYYDDLEKTLKNFKKSFVSSARFILSLNASINNLKDVRKKLVKPEPGDENALKEYKRKKKAIEGRINSLEKQKKQALIEAEAKAKGLQMALTDIMRPNSNVSFEALEYNPQVALIRGSTNISDFSNRLINGSTILGSDEIYIVAQIPKEDVLDEAEPLTVTIEHNGGTKTLELTSQASASNSFMLEYRNQFPQDVAVVIEDYFSFTDGDKVNFVMDIFAVTGDDEDQTEYKSTLFVYDHPLDQAIGMYKMQMTALKVAYETILRNIDVAVTHYGHTKDSVDINRKFLEERLKVLKMGEDKVAQYAGVKKIELYLRKAAAELAEATPALVEGHGWREYYKKRNNRLKIALERGKTETQEDLLRFLRDLTMGVYEMVAEYTDAGPLVRIVFGIDPKNGNELSVGDRVWSGLDFLGTYGLNKMLGRYIQPSAITNTRVPRRATPLPPRRPNDIHGPLTKFYGAKFKDCPPLHITNKVNLKSIKKNGLQPPNYSSQTSATFSYENMGPARLGDAAIRVKPESLGTYVRLVDSQGAGLAMNYFKSGTIGQGPIGSYIPSKHLQWFDVKANGGAGAWKSFKDLDLDIRPNP